MSLISAYNTLTTAIDVWRTEFGGDYDNHQELLEERDGRLQALSTNSLDTV